MEKHHISQVCEINPPKTIELSDTSLISFIPMDSVSTDGHVELDKTIEANRIKNYTVFKNGDVLFAKITPCMENGKGVLVNGLLNGFGAGSTEFIVLRPNTNIITGRWLYLFLSQTQFRMKCRQHMTGSAGQKRVPAKYLASCEIPIPSLSEQERIVARIEELFSLLDAGVETLKKTKAQLAVYRQAVLKEAFENENNSKERLKDLCFFITKGTTPSKDKLHNAQGDIPFIKVYNLTFDNSLDFSVNPTFIDADTHSGFLARSIVLPGDVLMNIVGPPMGKVSIVPNTYPEWNINQAIARFRCSDKLNNKYLAYYLGYSGTVDVLEKKTKATAGQFNLTLETCRDLTISLPSIESQERIVSELEAKLSNCLKVECTIDAALQQANAMQQSILKAAFEGRL